MHAVTMYETADGRTFHDPREAVNHAEGRLSAAIAEHARVLCQLNKYTEVCDYLERHANELAELAGLAKDRHLEK